MGGQMATMAQRTLAFARVNRQLAGALVQWNSTFSRLWQTVAGGLSYYMLGTGIEIQGLSL